MHPRAQRSDYGPEKSYYNSSGAIYNGVPTKVALLEEESVVVSSFSLDF